MSRARPRPRAGTRLARGCDRDVHQGAVARNREEYEVLKVKLRSVACWALVAHANTHANTQSAPVRQRRRCSRAVLGAPPPHVSGRRQLPQTRRLRRHTTQAQCCDSAPASQPRTRNAKEVERVVRCAPGVHVEHELLRRRLRVPLHHLPGAA